MNNFVRRFQWKINIIHHKILEQLTTNLQLNTSLKMLRLEDTKIDSRGAKYLNEFFTTNRF